MLSAHRLSSGFEFSPEEIQDAVRKRRLLSMELELSLTCNFRCAYCYVTDQAHSEPELTPEEIRDVILQAQELGARKIILLGGEPMIYPDLLGVVRFIRGRGLDVEMFTNGTNISPEVARELFELQTAVVLKMNSFRRETQDLLAGAEGAFDSIQAALAHLKAAGYPAPGRRLCVSSVICRQNLDELPALWQWARDQGIEPYLEMITPQENASRNHWLDVEPAQAGALFARIAEIDRVRYGKNWDPQPPLVGNHCLRHQFSCLVNAFGRVMPCVGVTLPVGSIREHKLRDILAESEVIQDLRNYRQMIQGPCAACEKAADCYGCRGAAYQLTGNYLASDPLCWRNQGKEKEVGQLPRDVESMIPQKAPMRVVNRLLAVGERFAVVEAVIPPDSPFLGQDGMLDEAAFLEIIAQATAALNGFRTPNNQTTAPAGYLLGARKLDIRGTARAGDRLNVRVFKLARYGDFGIVQGTVAKGDEVVALGEVKVWHNSDAAAAESALPQAAGN